MIFLNDEFITKGTYFYYNNVFNYTHELKLLNLEEGKEDEKIIFYKKSEDDFEKTFSLISNHLLYTVCVCVH